MTIILAPKRSTESVLYVFDWTPELAPTGDTIQSFTLTINSGAITAPAANQTNTDTIVQALIVGGSNLQTSSLTLTITTAAGQVLSRDYSLLVNNTTTSIFPSTTTKGQIEDMAFEELGLAGYTFETTSAEQSSGLQRLDSLMRRWQSIGLDVGYNFPASIGGSSRSDVSGVPDFAVDAAVVDLAMAMAPGYGKTLSVETRVRYQQSLGAVRTAFASIPDRQLPNATPLGAGNKPRSSWWPFIGSVTQ